MANNIHYYTNILGDAQHKARWGGITIPDMQIVVITTQEVLVDYQLSITTSVWGGKLPESNTQLGLQPQKDREQSTSHPLQNTRRVPGQQRMGRMTGWEGKKDNKNSYYLIKTNELVLASVVILNPTTTDPSYIILCGNVISEYGESDIYFALDALLA